MPASRRRVQRRMRDPSTVGRLLERAGDSRSETAMGRIFSKQPRKIKVSHSASAHISSVAAPPAPTSPTPPPPWGEEGIKKKLSWVFLPSLPRGERGRGSEGRRRGEERQ